MLFFWNVVFEFHVFDICEVLNAVKVPNFKERPLNALNSYFLLVQIDSIFWWSDEAQATKLNYKTETQGFKSIRSGKIQ